MAKKLGLKPPKSQEEKDANNIRILQALLDEERKKNDVLEAKLEEAQDDIDVYVEEHRESEQQIQKLETEATEMNAQIETLKDDLHSAKFSADALEDAVNFLTSRLDPDPLKDWETWQKIREAEALLGYNGYSG